MDCDLPDSSNAELSTPLRHIVTTGDGSPLLTDAMLVDQDERNPLLPLSSGDCAMTIESPLHDIEAPKEKSAFIRILEDMVPRNNANTKGGNQVENIHDDIDSYLQPYYLPPTSLPLRPLSASFLLLSTSHCYEIAINSAVPGVDLITSSG